MASQDQSAEQLFGAVLDLPPEHRASFLDSACHDAPELRNLVDRLLADYERLGGFLDEPIFAPAPQSPVPAFSSPLVHLPAGTRFGRYCVMEPLGFGGMGSVYRARDEKLERDVAIKILTPGVLVGEDARRRFRKEALALAKLGHARIAAVYDVGEQDGVDYIVMECVAGRTLAAKLESGPLGVAEATTILVQIAQALEDAHEQGVVHRDLKPANVMITPKGQVKILDFGIAKLIAALPNASLTAETNAIIGTPLYMSPEQAKGEAVDARSDLWSLGVLYYESLAGRPPFQAETNLAVLYAIIVNPPAPLRDVSPGLPPAAERIVERCLEKDPSSRYQAASQVVHDASDLLAQLTVPAVAPANLPRPRSRKLLFALAALLLLALAASLGYYRRMLQHQQWAREEALPEARRLFAAKKPLEAMAALQKAETYLPSDPQWRQTMEENSRFVSVTSSPDGATVQIQDYAAPTGPWTRLGVTPLQHVRIPNGYFRWKLSKPGQADWVAAPETESAMNFPLEALLHVPAGMVLAPGEKWRASIGFVGWLGPFKLPSYYIDRYEVTNRDYQSFVDSGGYQKPQYWTEKFTQEGRDLSFDEAMAKFRDTTGRPGPADWVAGHYPQGADDFPVSGVSWFEASAYATFAGKKLPVLAQWFHAAPTDLGEYTIPVSNISSDALARVGAYPGVGPFGTYDMAGNVREWIANPVDDGLRMILGGSWKSPAYLYFDPEALSPFDRSNTNGFRCVQNLGPMDEAATLPIRREKRDFASLKPISDSVFRAYEALYTYPKIPLNARSEGIVQETADWREEKVSFDTAYRGERMSAYLFLPKNVHPPYQTILFFPSARVLFLPDNKNGRALGDLKFVDYVIQSGRAVLYPVYEDMYERRVKFSLPGGAQNIQLTTDWYKDAARSLDFLASRSDIDSGKLAYMGVSMGSAEGVIATTLMQDRLKTAIFLDGGYFLDQPPPGGDQADFAPRMKKPVLMVNGRYDFTFNLDRSQTPLFNMLGTPEKDKRHVVLETPHDVTEDRPKLVQVVLDWLDQYLGRPN